MLVLLMLSASLQPILAFAQDCSPQNASTELWIHATAAPVCASPADESGVSALKGQYAFLLKGALTTPGIASRATAALGSFTADGQGNITSGEMDFTSAAETFQALPITGTYTLDSDSLMGTLNLTSTKGTKSFAIYTALPPYASGSLIETDGGPL